MLLQHPEVGKLEICGLLGHNGAGKTTFALGFYGGLAGLRGARLRREIDEVAEAVLLTEALGRTVEKLSGGQQRRAQAATVLLCRPSVLLMDEPTVGADPVALGKHNALILMSDPGTFVAAAAWRWEYGYAHKASWRRRPTSAPSPSPARAAVWPHSRSCRTGSAEVAPWTPGSWALRGFQSAVTGDHATYDRALAVVVAIVCAALALAAVRARHAAR